MLLLTLFTLPLLPACGSSHRAALITGQRLASALQAQGISTQVHVVTNAPPHSIVSLHNLQDPSLRERHIVATITGSGIAGYVYDTASDASAATPRAHNHEPIHQRGNKKTDGEFFRVNNAVVWAVPATPAMLRKVDRALNSLG